jgi:hypothetical protein
MLNVEDDEGVSVCWSGELLTLRSDVDRRIRDDEFGVRVATALCSIILPVLVRAVLDHDVGGVRD